MTPYPKHYLAEVPQDLRRRVLDLCIHRLWHDALDLLHQNGFTQYEWYEVVWFHDHAPTNLPESEPVVGRSVPAEPPPSPLSGRGLGEGDALTLTLPNLNAEPRTGNPEPLTLTVGRGVPAEPNLNGAVKVPKFRSKIARLPQDLQLNLNSMLKDGRPYPEIIAWLNESGHPGFNKVNLHNWRITGFQDWLRDRQPKTTTV